MGVSEFFDLVRENLGFLAIFAFLMPCTIRHVDLVSGSSAWLFTSVIGVAGAYITFEGITFDFDFFRFVLDQTIFYWLVGMVFVIMNIIILMQIWKFSIGDKTRNELLTTAAYITAFSFFLGGLYLYPIPWVAGAAIVRAMTTKPKVPPPKVIQAPEGEEVAGEEEPLYETTKEPETPAPAQLETKMVSEIFEVPEGSAMRRRIPRFFIHGVAFSLLDLLFGMLWPILTGLVLASASHLETMGTLIGVVFAFGSLFVGGGLINAWIAERVWNIDWEYGIGTVFLSGLILFVVSQVLVSPLSLIVNTYLLDSIVGIAIVVIFRYTVVAFFLGIVGLLISLNFKPKKKPEIKQDALLDQIERVVGQTTREESVPDEAKNEPSENQTDDEEYVPDDARNY